MEKDSGKRKGEEQLKGETNPEVLGPAPQAPPSARCVPGWGGRALWLGSYSASLTLTVFTSDVGTMPVHTSGCWGGDMGDP